MMVAEKPTMEKVAREVKHTLSGKREQAADAIIECLSYNPDYVESWDASDEQAEFADGYCSIYYSDAVKWYNENPEADDCVNEYYSQFGPDLLRAEDASSIIHTLITGGQYIEAYRLWDEIWDIIKAEYEAQVEDWELENEDEDGDE